MDKARYAVYRSTTCASIRFRCSCYYMSRHSPPLLSFGNLSRHGHYGRRIMKGRSCNSFSCTWQPTQLSPVCRKEDARSWHGSIVIWVKGSLHFADTKAPVTIRIQYCVPLRGRQLPLSTRRYANEHGEHLWKIWELSFLSCCAIRIVSFLSRSLITFLSTSKHRHSL